MPVVDHKPIGKDCDDNHHSKLVDRQGKNDNDTSPVLLNIHIGSAIAVQHEDSRPWTHGTVVNMGNQNHHDRSYVIQLTINGRHISRNRWHIRPTTVTADKFLQYQYNKQSSIKTDPLAEILNNINRNPAIYSTGHTRNTNNTCEQYNEQSTNKIAQQETNIEQYNKKPDSGKERGTSSSHDGKASLQENKVNRTRSGCIAKSQTDSHIYIHSNRPADMLATPQMSYGWHHYFAILSIFLYDILPAGQQANIQQLLCKCRSLTHSALQTHS